jgi:hypothetical protein
MILRIHLAQVAVVVITLIFARQLAEPRVAVPNTTNGETVTLSKWSTP